MPRSTRSGTPLKYWISFVTSKPSKKINAGARPVVPSGWTHSAGRWAPSYGISTGSTRGRRVRVAASRKHSTPLL